MRTQILVWTLVLSAALSGCVAVLPTAPQGENDIRWQAYRADSGYEIQYPLASHSMRDGRTGPEVLFPGVKVVEPNDGFFYQEPRAQTYRLSIAVSENREGMTLDDAEQLLARSQLLPYDPALLVEATIEEFMFDGAPAIRVNDLAAGPSGITTQIVALHGPFIYELLAEPHDLTGNQAVPWLQPAPSPANRQLLEAIIATFRFTGDDEAAPTTGAAQGDSILAWQGYTAMGDGDPTRCKQMAIDADGNVEFGLCDGPAESRPPSDSQEWTEIQTRFAPFTLDAVSDSVAFSGVGDLAGPAWQRALLAWTHFTYGELVSGRTSASARTALSWYLGEAPDQPGLCNHLTVLVYGYAYAQQAACQGGGTVQNPVGGWLTTAEIEAFDALLYRRGPLYEGDNYFSGLGDQPWNDGDSALVEEWAQQVYARLVDTTAAGQAEPCAVGFVQARALTADATHGALHNFSWPEPGEPVLLGWDPALWETIVQQLVDAGARYLNECASFSPTGEPTAATLEELAQLSRVVPHLEVTIPGEGDFLPLDLVVTETVAPVAQLLDIDNDGRSEVLLHTQVGYFDGEQILFGVRGGVSIVYEVGEAGWQGHVIWPVYHYIPRADDYLEYAPFRSEQAAEQANWTAAQALIYDPAPQVEPLNLTDADGNAYLAVSHVRRTPLDDIRELTVMRWRPQGPESALHIMLDNWCVSAEWAIGSDGAIAVPALPEPFPHCQGTYDEQTFVLKAGRFVAQP